MLAGFANGFELCQHERGMTVIGQLRQCSHVGRPREIKKFAVDKTIVCHPGKGQFVINGRRGGHSCDKASPSKAVLLQYSG